MDYSVLKDWLKLKKVLVHHMDVDGTCAAAQVLRFEKADTFSLKDPHLYPELLDFLERKKPEAVFFLDLSIDQEWQDLVDLKNRFKKTNFCIIDHHKITKDMNKYGYLHLNPRFEKEDSYVPTSLMVYRLLIDLDYPAEQLLWLAAIGTISDFGHKANPDFINICKKTYPDLLKGKNIFNTRLGNSSKTIYSAIICEGIKGVSYLLNVLKKYKFENFEKDENLRHWREIVDDEIKRVLEDFEKNKQVDGKVIFYEVKSNLGITSIVSNCVTEIYQDFVIVIAKNDREGWKFSVRAPKLKINLAVLVPKCAKGIGRGGGHEKAAGGLVFDMNEFRKRLVHEVNKI